MLCVYCDNSTAVAYICKQGGTHSISLFNKTLELFHLLDQFGILLIPTHLPGARNVTADARQNGGFLRKPYSGCSLPSGPPGGHVRHSEGPGDSNLHFTLPRRQSMGSKRPLHTLGRLRTSVRLSSSSHSPQNSPENQGLSRHHGDSNHFTAPVSTVTSLLLLLSQRPHIPLTDLALYQYVPNMKRPQFHGEPHLLDLATWLLSGTSWNSTISQTPSWTWQLILYVIPPVTSIILNGKPLPSGPMTKASSPRTSFVSLAEYLVHLYAEGKQVHTIKVHQAAIANVLKMINLPTILQEETIHNVICRMNILRPGTQEIFSR